MARLSDGRIAFVTGGIPGDVIHPVGVEAGKGHVRATRWTLVQASAERVTPPCPVVDACGGCDWMAIERTRQLVHKGAILEDALSRVGHLGRVPDDARAPATAASGDLEYRSRVRFHVDPSGKIGFFARGTHDLVEIPRCAVCQPELNDALARLRRVPRDSLAAFSTIDVRRSDEEPRVAVSFTPRVRGGAGLAKRAAASVLPKTWSVTVVGDEHEEGAEQRFLLAGGITLRAAPGVFTQVNWPVNAALVEAVVSGATTRGVRRFFDAYAGAGNFSLPLIAAGMSGTSVDSDARAVECARKAGEEHGLDVSGFVADDAGRFAGKLARAKERFDLALLDPPRSGAPDVLSSIATLSPAFVAYCSCDPVTLARDLATLERARYRLESVRSFDMFPHTHHLESLAWLRRDGPGGDS
jgi:23S rRNA (uracil1939-C5)-methyltransferase